MSTGPDVDELNANSSSGVGRDFRRCLHRRTPRQSGASVAVAQPHRELLLGSVVRAASAARHGPDADAWRGLGVMAGPVLTASSTARQVTIELDAADQGESGSETPSRSPPDNQTTRADFPRELRASPAARRRPTIEVDAVPTILRDGSLDEAPLTSRSPPPASLARSSSRRRLLALSSGVTRSRWHGARAASRGVAPAFDDADGLVQISGAASPPATGRDPNV